MICLVGHSVLVSRFSALIDCLSLSVNFAMLSLLAPGAGQDLGDRQIGNGGDVEVETACVFQVGQLWCGQQRRKFFVSCLFYRSYSQGSRIPV